MTEGKRLLLFFDTEIVRAFDRAGGIPEPQYPRGFPFIVDDWCKKQNIVTRGGSFSMIDFLDPVHPVIDATLSQIIGYIHVLHKRLYLYVESLDAEEHVVKLGRYLMYLPLWKTVHNAASFQGYDSLLIISQN